jgi:hypothetical protein
MSLQQDLDAAMHSMTKVFDTANQAAAAINRKVIEIAQRNLNVGFDLAKIFTEDTRTPLEIVRLQIRYWRKQFDQLAAQAEKAWDHLFGFSTATSEPSSESSVKEPVKRSPASAQKGKSPTPRNPTAAMLGQRGTQTPRLSGRAEQPEIPKKGTPTDKLERMQKSPGQDPVDEGAKPRATRKAKARSSSSPAPQSLPTDISFGMLDGNAVRFTNLEAWWLVDGAWRPLSPDEVLSNAAVMREARFKQLFPHIPLLPEDAFQSRQR